MALQDDWLGSYGGAALAREEGRPRRRCATMAIHNALLERHPVFRTLLAALEQETLARLADGAALAGDEEVEIPVVVHVVWHDPSEDIADAQVVSQIEVLNQDFASANADISGVPEVWAGLVRDAGIRFRLAARDPQGEQSSGITRTRTGIAGFAPDDSVKFAELGGADAWPAERYLNIWVCNLEAILGYAQFPGGPPETDGVVVGHRYFGTTGTAIVPFDRGRTTTHEVGHWLNLRHIWGDREDCAGSDLVDDTPVQQLPNFGQPSFPSPSCGNEPDGDMFMNYMDYVDDAAMFMFTAGQVARMRATLDSIRVGLRSGDGPGDGCGAGPAQAPS